MRVTLIASTQMAEAHGYRCVSEEWLPLTGDDLVCDSDHLAEFAGRACYQSFDRPNPQTARNADYVANILRQQHFSVLEHASATFYIEGVSRSLTHELVRHRHLSFSQLSQRYVDESDAEFVAPPAMQSVPTYDPLNALNDVGHAALQAYRTIVTVLEDAGLPRKLAREAARSVLPNATATKIVVTGNHRAWREFLQKRWHVAADAEIRQLAGLLLAEMRAIAPHTYQDIPDRPYGVVA
jgi:thymidylate synthase (FAD)